MAPSKSHLIVRNVVAVREDPGRRPEIIPQQFELRVRHSQQGLVLFCLVFSFADGAPTTKTTIYLQVTADSIGSLDRTRYAKTDANQNSPYLEHVYERLNGMQSVTGLRFQLRSGEGIQLVVPLDFDVGNISNTARSTFERTESLAAALSFSLYFQHNVLSKDRFLSYQKAISLHLTDGLRKSYKDMLDVQRMYKGVGGKVHKLRSRHDSSPTREHSSYPAPATTASCGSTLPFDTVPRREQESPPPYDECLNERQSPRARPDAAATVIFAESPAGAPAPPKYDDTERRHDALDPFQGVPCGSEDTDIHLTTKRKRSLASVRTTWMTAGGASRPGKMLRSGFVHSDDQSNVERLLQLQGQHIELQRQQIDQLQKEVEELRRWNKELDGRHDELEADCFELTNRQDRTDDAIELLHVDVNQLEEKHGEVVKQMPDVCDEFKEMKESMGETFKEDILQSALDSVVETVEGCVEAHIEKVKTRIRQALQ